MKVFLGRILPFLLLCCCSENRAVGEVTTTGNCPSINNTVIHAIPGKPTPLNDVTLSNSQKSFSIAFDDSNTLFGFQRKTKDSVDLIVYAPPSQNIRVTIKNNTCTFKFVIKMQPCPIGFEFNSKHRLCKCSDPTRLDIIQCDNTNFSAKVFVGFCVSREENTSLLLVTRCPFASHPTHVYVPLVNGTSDFCSTLNRQNMLCSECKKKHCVSVFSDIFECIKWHGNHWGNVAAYLAIELIPTTFFFLVILYFHIGVTTGPANGFIFFSQMMTLPIEVIFLHYGLDLFYSSPTSEKYLAKTMAHVIDPYSIWNLDFYRIFNTRICLSEGLKVINILALRYISAVYPLVLLLIAYIFIEMQAMNIRPIVWLWKIVCFPCTRWRRVWKARTSIVDAFATCILLSYNKFMYVSFLLLSHSDVYIQSGRGKKVLNFDPSITFLSREHIPYFALSIVVILIFGIFPPILLTFYQFRFCTSCLERLRLRRPGLEQFIEAFQGCYKDKTNGTADRRFFAGLYFVFRVVMLLVTSQSKDVISLLQAKAVAYIIFLLVCAITQPYKKAFYTFIDCLFFALLAIIAIFQLYTYVLLKQDEKMSRDFLLYYFGLYIPLLYMTCYVARWLILCYKNRDSDRYVIQHNNDSLREPTIEESGSPAFIDISPRPSIVTHTEVSITELSQERKNCSDSDNMSDGESEAAPLIKKRELEIFSQHGATVSQDNFF